jgi:ABC-type dipeptide/oligopeptide/nickel transport system permease component
MIGFIVRRLIALIPVLIGISFIAFFLLQLVPGDPALALLGPMARPEDLAALRTALGLDQPILVQYLRWMGRVLQGDLGVSIQLRSPVLPILIERFGNTLILTVAAVLISTVIGVAAGVISATRQFSFFDRASMIFALFGNSMPAFWLGLMAILIFSLNLGWFPAAGMWPITGPRTIWTLLHHLTLPAVTLGIAAAAVTARITRSSMLEVIRQDYVRTARAKGLQERTVVLGHALKNALLPVLTVVGVQFGFLLGGAVLTETVFSWPGIGLALYNAISVRDFPMVQGGVLLVATAFVLVNLGVDLLYALIDPRIEYSE